MDLVQYKGLITITDSAAKAILNLQEKHKNSKIALRVGVTGGGCSGFSYKMDMAEEPNDGDQIFEKNGAKVYVDPKSLKLIDGTELDYDNSLAYSGFKFKNPKAKATCGCGSSFSLT